MTSHNAADIRNLMNLLDSVLAPELPSQTMILNEGPFTGLKAAMGDSRAQGELQRADLADRMAREWKVWLGQTNRTGTIEDMVQYLHVRVGLEPDDIRIIMGHEESEPEPSVSNNYRSPEPEDQDDIEDEPSPRAHSPSPETTEPQSAYAGLSPEQKAELQTKGEITLPDGRRLWVGNKEDDTPPIIRKIKDSDVDGAADDLANLSPSQRDGFMASIQDQDFSDREWSPLRNALLDKESELRDDGQGTKARELRALVRELEGQLDLKEAILAEQVLTKQQAKMVFDDASKYVFANGVLNRSDKPGSRPRGRTGFSDVDNERIDGAPIHKIRAFLRQNDVTDEMVHSLRETARRARTLGSFKGQQDHKVLAMIGLAYLKYRD